MVTFIKCSGDKEVGEKCAEYFAQQLQKKKNSVLGLATGGTPVSTYKRLIQLYNEGTIDFSEVTAFNLDEYIGLDDNSDQSYVYFMAENLFNHVNIKKENTNIPNGKASDPEEECKRYDKLLNSCGGIDIQLLGIGVNGHIGFNEPAESFSEGTTCVDLTEETINSNSIFFDHIDDVPKRAITMGIGSIMKANKIILLAIGSKKTEALKAAFTGEITPNVPASVLQEHPDVIVIGDEAALSFID